MGEVFGDRVIATAILDRLLHHAVTLEIRGNSYRLKEKFKAGTLVRAKETKIHEPGGGDFNSHTWGNPGSPLTVLSLDEKTQIQALKRTQPMLPMRPGLPARQTHDYRRNGLTSLYAALEVASGNVIGECSERHTGADLRRLPQARCTGAIRTRDCTSSSTTPRLTPTPGVREWLEQHPQVHFHFTPTGASWLNMVEAWFGILTRKSIRRGSFDSVRALVKHIGHYIEHWNDHPTPFVWTKSPADIIRKAVRRR